MIRNRDDIARTVIASANVPTQKCRSRTQLGGYFGDVLAMDGPDARIGRLTGAEFRKPGRCSC